MVVDPGTENPLEGFFAHCPSLLFVADPGGAIRAKSAALGRFLGLADGALAALADLVHPADRADFSAAWAKLGEGADPISLDLRVRADGGFRAVSLTARRSPANGEILGEIRERAAAEGPLPAEVTRDLKVLRVLLDTLPIVLWVLDREGVFLHTDGKAMAVPGNKPGAYVGVSVFDLLAGSPRIPLIRMALAGEPQRSAGEAIGVEWQNWYVPSKDDRGEVEMLVGISMDMTEPTRAERELREKMALIERQQAVIRDLATPIIEVWDKVLTVPMLGIVDSMRAAELMENLLAQVSRKGSRFALLDLTGVDAVDTSTASHLIKLTQALKLLGADAIITGIQPSVAQTMVALGVDMESITTSAKLRDGLRLCIRRLREEKG